MLLVVADVVDVAAVAVRCCCCWMLRILSLTVPFQRDSSSFLYTISLLGACMTLSPPLATRTIHPSSLRAQTDSFSLFFPVYLSHAGGTLVAFQALGVVPAVYTPTHTISHTITTNNGQNQAKPNQTKPKYIAKNSLSLSTTVTMFPRLILDSLAAFGYGPLSLRSFFFLSLLSEGASERARTWVPSLR